MQEAINERKQVPVSKSQPSKPAFSAAAPAAAAAMAKSAKNEPKKQEDDGLDDLMMQELLNRSAEDPVAKEEQRVAEVVEVV